MTTGRISPKQCAETEGFDFSEPEPVLAYIFKICGLAYGALHPWLPAIHSHLVQCSGLLENVQAKDHLTIKLSQLVVQCESLFQNTFVFSSDFLKRFPDKKQALSTPKKERLFLEVISICINMCMADICIVAGIKDNYEELEVSNVTGFDKKMKMAQYFDLGAAAVRDTPRCEQAYVKEMYNITSASQSTVALLYLSSQISVKSFGYPTTEQSKEKKAFISKIVHASMNIQEEQTGEEGTEDVLQRTMQAVFGLDGQIPDVTSQTCNVPSVPQPQTSPDISSATRNCEMQETDQNATEVVSQSLLQDFVAVGDARNDAPRTDSPKSIISEIICAMDRTLGELKGQNSDPTRIMCDTPKRFEGSVDSNRVDLTERCEMTVEEAKRGLEFLESALSRLRDSSSLVDLQKLLYSFMQISKFVVESNSAAPKENLQYVQGQFQLSQDIAFHIKTSISSAASLSENVITLAGKVHQKFSTTIDDMYPGNAALILNVVWEYLTSMSDVQEVVYGLRCVFDDFKDVLKLFLYPLTSFEPSTTTPAELPLLYGISQVVSQLSTVANILQMYLTPSVSGRAETLSGLLTDLQPASS